MNFQIVDILEKEEDQEALQIQEIQETLLVIQEVQEIILGIQEIQKINLLQEEILLPEEKVHQEEVLLDHIQEIIQDHLLKVILEIEDNFLNYLFF